MYAGSIPTPASNTEVRMIPMDYAEPGPKEHQGLQKAPIVLSGVAVPRPRHRDAF